MKFSSYHQQIAPNVIGTQGYRTTNDANVYGSGRGQEAMASAIGQVNKVLSKQQDDMDAMQLTEARNDILTNLNSSLYGENGLFTTGVGENAFGLTDRTNDTIKKTFAEIGKNYNPRVRYALKLNMKDNIDNYQRIAASKEQGEVEKYKTALENSSMDQYKQDMADNFADDKIVEDSVYGAVRQLAARGKRLGWSGQEFQQQSRDLVSNMVGSAIDSALQVDEVDRAGQILENYGNLMNMDAYTKVANYVKRRTAIRDEKKFAEKLLEDCKNPDGSYNLSMYQDKLKKFQDGRLAAPAAYAYEKGKQTAGNPQGNGNAGGATTKTIDSTKLFNGEGKADTRYVDTGRELDATVQEMGQKYNVPTPLIHAVIEQESGYDGGAVSSAGAQGLMQLMPDTGRAMGVTDPFDYKQNIEGGVKYLKDCLDATNGDIHQALARYNGGPGYMNTGEAQRYADQVEARIKKMNGTNPLPEAKESSTIEEKTQENSQQNEIKKQEEIDKDVEFKPLPKEGLISRGPVDIYHRPIHKNEDGSISTVNSVSYGTNRDGKNVEVLVATVLPDGSMISEDEAIKRSEDAYANGKESDVDIAVFDSPEHATAYAKALHDMNEKVYEKPDDKELVNLRAFRAEKADHPERFEGNTYKSAAGKSENQNQFSSQEKMPENGSTVRTEVSNLSRSNLSARARGIRGVNPGADPELLDRLTGYGNQIANKQTEDNKERAEALAIQADRAYADRASALAFIESHKGEFTMAGYNYLKSLIDSNEKFAPPRPVRSGGGGGGRYRGGGSVSGRGRRTGMYGEDGEYYSAAEIKRAKKNIKEYWRKIAPGNDETITEAQQERYDEAAHILTTTGIYEGGADVEEQRETYNNLMGTARAVWKQHTGDDSPYTNTVNDLVENYGFDETTAITILDQMPDED